MSPQLTRKHTFSEHIPKQRKSSPHPDPDPEPPAAPPIIILSQSGKAASPHVQEPDPEHAFQPHSPTSSSHQATFATSRYNLRKRPDSNNKRGKSPTPDPFPCAPPVIILSHKRPASSSPPRSPPSIETNTSHPPSSNPPSASTISPTAPLTAQTSVAPTPATENPLPNSPAAYFPQFPVPAHDKATYTKHRMGSKASKLSPAHGKLQPSQEKQDKAEMKEPSNYYSHRSKSMRRKAGRTGATDGAGGAGGAAGGGVGGAV